MCSPLSRVTMTGRFGAVIGFTFSASAVHLPADRRVKQQQRQPRSAKGTRVVSSSTPQHKYAAQVCYPAADMFPRSSFSAVAITSFLLTITAQAQLSPAVAAQVDQAAAHVLETTGVPSASIAIVEDGKLAYVKAYGKAHLPEDGTAALDATPAMQYSVGSISKQFTAAAIMLLVEQGKLTLDDPVSKFLPGLTRADEVTVRMVLSHTSGYQDYWPEDYVMTSMLVPTNAQHILDVWAHKPLDFEPGAKWQYSNTNYVIAGRIVEQLSRDNLIHFLTAHIFTPLSMNGVLNSDAARLPAGDPIGYQRYALGPSRPAPKEGAGWMFAAGELAMSPSDLAKWNISIIQQSLLKPSSYAEMFKPVMLKDGKSSGYGLGFFIRQTDHGTVYEHSGEVSGFVSENVVDANLKMAITVLTNEMASPAAGMLTRDIAPLLSMTTRTSQSDAAKQAEEIFTQLQAGKLDRSLLTDYCNAYFSQQAIDDFKSSLAQLGPPASVTQTADELRGGMTFRSFKVQFAGEQSKSLSITTYVMPDGKIEQYLVEPND